MDESQEEVIGIKIDSFINKIDPKIVRLPKKKSKEVDDIKGKLLDNLGSDKTTNLATVVNLLKFIKMSKVRHLLSGGKDSAALTVYMKTKYPSIDVDFYSCDTGKELDETYQLIKNLEVYLGIQINLLRVLKIAQKIHLIIFLSIYGGYLPSSTARWCANKLKLEPFENYVGDDDVVSYVRGDEEGGLYFNKKKYSVYIPFRQNIWSKDVTQLVQQNLVVLKFLRELVFRL